MTCIVHCDLLLATGVMLGCFASLPLDFYVSGVALVENARFPAFLFEILRAFQDAQHSWDVSARVGPGTSPTLYILKTHHAHASPRSKPFSEGQDRTYAVTLQGAHRLLKTRVALALAANTAVSPPAVNQRECDASGWSARLQHSEGT